MEKKDLRIVYMGTPEFAVESLKRLVEGGVSGGRSHYDARQAHGTAWKCSPA